MNNNQEWQPCILLPASLMCEKHRKLLASMPIEIQNTRESYIGKKLRMKRAWGSALDPIDPRIKLPEFECSTIEVMNDKGETTFIFSCEVSTD